MVIRQAWFVAAVMTACRPDHHASAERPTEVPPTPDPLARTVEDAMDLGSDPCTDFYQYACGGWIADAEIPDDKPFTSRSSTQIKRVMADLQAIVERDTDGPLGRFYDVCLDQGARARDGAAAARSLAAMVDDVSSPPALARVLARLHSVGAEPLFEVAADPDPADAGSMIVLVFPRQPSLGDAAMYGQESTAVPYRLLISRTLALAGYPEPERAAELVVGFERRLASIQESAAQAPRSLQSITAAELERLAPAIDWPTYLRGLGVQSPTRVLPAMPSGIPALQRELVATSDSTRRAYLTWALLSRYADALGPDIEREHDEFQRGLSGRRAPRTRAELCVDATLGALPQEIDRKWIEWRYSALSSRKAGAMLAAIRDSLEVRLNTAVWLDEPTRHEALRKLASFGVQLGHPETWPDEPALAIGERHVDNLMSASRRAVAREFSRVGRPMDPTVWQVPAVTVGAYYHGGSNTMLFPAGILQPPYFDPAWPNSINFGGVGVVMGHELTHAFDSFGSRRDASAQARNWWTATTAGAFEDKARCIAAHLSTYELAPGIPMAASRVLDEAISDIGGVKVAHQAYRQLAAKHGEDPSARFGQRLTHDQLFFVAFAQNACVKQTPAFEQARARSDSHAPARARVNSPLAQSPAFWGAFTCEPGEPMYAKVECDLW